MAGLAAKTRIEVCSLFQLQAGIAWNLRIPDGADLGGAFVSFGPAT